MDTVTDKRLIVEFSGWMECDPEKTTFVYVGDDAFEGVMGGDIHITGREYMTLSPEQQGDFILSCLGETYMDSLDGELVHCDVEIDEL
ncbi:MAG TPA: hypothetical protein DCM04_07740 [Saprospirales bacterium]|nr:hypothetical protein [Saprospirales bacterium]|tara:strand:+ start:162 stop:425 length:264 start_codon:yes stop_codon:yes gene_type:complete